MAHAARALAADGVTSTRKHDIGLCRRLRVPGAQRGRVETRSGIEPSSVRIAVAGEVTCRAGAGCGFPVLVGDGICFFLFGAVA